MQRAQRNISQQCALFICQEKACPVQISLPFQKRKVSENTLHKNRSSLERKSAGKMHQNWRKCRQQEKIPPEIVQFLTDLKSGRKILLKSTIKSTASNCAIHDESQGLRSAVVATFVIVAMTDCDLASCWTQFCKYHLVLLGILLK